MIFSITHSTEYTYQDFVSYCHNLLTLKPREHAGQELLEYSLEISPEPTEISDRQDFFGNNLTQFSIQNQHKKLEVIARSKIKRDFSKEFASYQSAACKSIDVKTAQEEFRTLDPERMDINQFVLESPLIRKYSDEIKEYALKSFQPDRSLFEAGYELMERIFTDFEYLPGFTNVATPLNDVIQHKKGVCQDFAQVAIACIRSVGLPAKYISGYIETLPPEGQEKLIGSDASHAWFAMYIPTFGWVEFDPTNNKIPNEQHIVVAWGRDYNDVPPLKGVVFSNGESMMKVGVDIRQMGK